MALKPTIYKCRIALSDTDRHYYDELSLTIAQHPSETMERMMVRVLAFCLNAQQGLEFSKGLSTPDEPDLWAHNLNGTLDLWIDVGEPALERIKKASHIARSVKVYSFNTKSDTWWAQGAQAFQRLDARFYRFEWPQIQALAALADRTMDMSVTITGDSLYVATARGESDITCTPLRA